jgi:hypothetical protein
LLLGHVEVPEDQQNLVHTGSGIPPLQELNYENTTMNAKKNYCAFCWLIWIYQKAFVLVMVCLPKFREWLYYSFEELPRCGKKAIQNRKTDLKK